MTTQKALGDAIVERSAGAKLDPRAKAAAREFAKQHKAYAAACEVAAKKEEARNTALAAVGVADETLDTSIDDLANRLVGNGDAKRNQPFAGLSEHPPGALCALSYAAEIAEAAKLNKAVRKRKPAKNVLAACAAIDAAATKTKAALKVFDAAQKEFQQACAARDALALPWQKSLTRYRVLAKAALIDDEGAYEALFAPPDAITVVKRKPKKKPAKSTPSRAGAGAGAQGGASGESA